MKKAIVLLSGGQDSTTCLFWAKQMFTDIIALGFNYGQKHKKELECAKEIAAIAGVPYIVIDIEGTLSGSSLVDRTKDVSAPHDINPKLPSSFTPGRNALFLTLAAGYGYTHGYHDIIGGMCQMDFSGYPDCRREFIDSMEKSLSLGLDSDVHIHTPLMYLSKARTWKMAKDISTKEFDVLEIVRTKTLTDYNGNMTMNEWGMGEANNPASILRMKSYFEAKEKGWL